MWGGEAVAGEQGLIIGLVFAIGMNAFSYFFSEKMALSMYQAQPMTREQNPELDARVRPIVERLTQKMGLPMPKLWVILGATPNAFATGRDPEHSSVAITAGLLGIMNDRELEGVIAHELGHVKHRDILISSVAATLAAALTGIARMSMWFGMGRSDDDERGGGYGGIVMIIVAPIAAWLIQMAISRQREYAADAAAARYTGTPDGSDQCAPINWNARQRATESPWTRAPQRLTCSSFLQSWGDCRNCSRPILRWRESHPRQSGIRARTGCVNSIKVNRKAAGRIASGHPWIFGSDIVDRKPTEDGAPIEVYDERGKFLGAGHYSSTSQIAVRLLTTRREEIGRDLYLRRLRQAIAHRERIIQNSDAYRLVFSEADLLPGLIIDKYGPYLVLQSLTQGMDRAQPRDSVEYLTELRAPAGILARNDASVRKLENLPQETKVIAGDIPERVTIQMNGLALTADLMRGQKTGTYLDQRENYVAAAKYAHGKVLDCFSSTGGFALHVAKQVESVDAIESSPLAIETAKANAAANGVSNIEFRQADVFDYLSGRDAKYSTIILDPPAFAKSRKQIDAAARGYEDINVRALRMLEPWRRNLATCSCSHHVSEAMLLEIVAEAALDTGRTLRILERRTQASDHPILLTVPETLYLKCLIFEAIS